MADKKNQNNISQRIWRDDKIYHVSHYGLQNTSYIHSNALNPNENSESVGIFNDMLAIPNWNIGDFINERMRFQTYGLESNDLSLYSDTGNFFYKLFFNFNTGYGLLGSVVTASNNNYSTEENTAWQFLTNNINSERFGAKYTNILKKKRDSLEKFCKILNYLVSECPWFFKEVSGLDAATNFDFSEKIIDDSKEITITFNPDAIDMRISVLLDLYKDACYDFANFREIIPENLRKFDMGIILFNGPIIGLNIDKYPKINPYLNKCDTGTVKCKSLSHALNELGLSFQYLILKNCEIKLSGLKSFPDTVNNEVGFQKECSMTISFQRSYIYDMNNELDISILDGMKLESPEINPDEK